MECVREAQIPGEEDVLINDDLCAPPRPADRELCNSQSRCSAKRQMMDLPLNLLKEVWSQTVFELINEPTQVLKVF